MESPTNSSTRAAGGGGATKAPSDAKAMTLRFAAGPQRLTRDSVSRVSVTVALPLKSHCGSQRPP